MPLLTQGKTNWKYILILLILAEIVGGGTFNYLKHFEREIESLTKFPEIKKPERVIKDETANWKTYRNEEYGFEIKYPQDWTIKESEVGYQMSFKQFTLQRIGETQLEGFSFIQIYPESFPTHLPPDVNIKKQEIYFAGKKATATLFLTSNKSEVWLEIISNISDLPGSWSKDGYLIISPKAKLEKKCAVQPPPTQECSFEFGEVYFGEVDQNEWELLTKILSTFQFLDESRELAHWKTYQSPTMGFSIKYPPDWIITPEVIEEDGKRVTFQKLDQGKIEGEFVVKRGASFYSVEKARELSCEEFLESKLERKRIFLDHLPALVESSISASRATNFRPFKTTHICQDSEKIEIYLTINDYDEEKEKLYSSIFKKMLSTFKITGVINFSESYLRENFSWPIFENWSVYRNDKYKFEIKYPEDYELTEENYTPVGPAIVSQKQKIKIIFEVYDNPSFLSLSQWAFNYNPSIKWQKILINGVESLKSQRMPCNECEEWKDLGNLYLPTKWEILIYKKEKIIKILIAGESIGAEEMKLYQILSTFRLLQ